MTINTILIIILLLLAVVQYFFGFEFDVNYETGDLLLWYNGKNGRAYVVFIPKYKDLW